MKKRIPVSFGDNILNINIPTSWEELSQDQLKKVYLYMSVYDSHTYKVAIFLMLSGIKILENIDEYSYLCKIRDSKGTKFKFVLRNESVASLIDVVDWLDDPGCYPVRIETIRKHKACNHMLHGVRFYDYIACENYYQGFLEDQSPEPIIKMANILYGANFTELRKDEFISIIAWFSAVKNLFSNHFSNFFKKTDGSANAYDMEQIMNAQIRALTGGDITKEADILQLDCWRALTELDAKAREASELNSKLKK